MESLYCYKIVGAEVVKFEVKINDLSTNVLNELAQVGFGKAIKSYDTYTTRRAFEAIKDGHFMARIPIKPLSLVQKAQKIARLVHGHKMPLCDLMQTDLYNLIEQKLLQKQGLI